MLENDIHCVIEWLCANKLTLSVVKSEFMVIGSRQRLASLSEDLDLSVNGITLKQAHEVSCLGLKIDENLTWKGHIEHIKKESCNKFTHYKKSQSIC